MENFKVESKLIGRYGHGLLSKIGSDVIIPTTKSGEPVRLLLNTLEYWNHHPDSFVVETECQNK